MAAAMAAAAALSSMDVAAASLLAFRPHLSPSSSPNPAWVPQDWKPHGNGEPYRQPWAPEEDAILRRSVAQYGARQWTLAAAALPGRSAKQCRERWVGALDPSIIQAPFTEVEDELVLTAYLLLGSRWAEMAKMLTGRTDNAVKNRANSGLRALLAHNAPDLAARDRFIHQMQAGGQPSRGSAAECLQRSMSPLPLWPPRPAVSSSPSASEPASMSMLSAAAAATAPGVAASPSPAALHLPPLQKGEPDLYCYEALDGAQQQSTSEEVLRAPAYASHSDDVSAEDSDMDEKGGAARGPSKDDEVIGARLPERLRHVLYEACVRATSKLDDSRSSQTSGGGWSHDGDEPVGSRRGASSGSGRREARPVGKGSPSKQGLAASPAPPSLSKSAACKKRSRGTSAEPGSAGNRLTESVTVASDEPASNGATAGPTEVDSTGSDSKDTWGKGKRRRVASASNTKMEKMKTKMKVPPRTNAL